ncbi:leucine-rich repeat domain-containing protein [Motilimonas sp. KMU-193]|uniref:leucine-rich repeat domain-containing protein n=1 Tax=Motilimonas sp. KMU-193 TaxID=3388668 RepID=UPI00396AF03F
MGFPLKFSAVLLGASVTLVGCGGSSASKLVDDIVDTEKQRIKGQIQGLVEPITLEVFGQQVTLDTDGSFDLDVETNNALFNQQLVEQGEQVCLLSPVTTDKLLPSVRVNCAAKLPLADAIAKVPHENLRQCLSTNLTQTYAHEVTEIKCNQYLIDRVTGLNDFIALESLNFTQNGLSEIDLSANWALKDITIYNNQLTSLDLSELTHLSVLKLLSTGLSELDVTHNPSLTELWLVRDQLEQIDVSTNKHLEKLILFNNPLMQIDVSNNPKLTMLNLANTQITALDVSQLAALEVLVASNTKIDYLDLSNSNALTSLLLANTQLADIDLTNNTGLKTLNLSKNQLTQLPTGLANISDKTAEINLTQNPLSDSAKANAAQLQLEYSKLTY